MKLLTTIALLLSINAYSNTNINAVNDCVKDTITSDNVSAQWAFEECKELAENNDIDTSDITYSDLPIVEKYENGEQL